MSESYGRCPLCGGDRAPGVVTFTADLKFGVVIVREVPALVCAQCGEEWIEHPVAKKLQTVVDEARRKKTVVEVAEWRHVA